MCSSPICYLKAALHASQGCALFDVEWFAAITSVGYGLFIFSKSKDCNINAAKLIHKLNSYRWAQDDLEWCSRPDYVNVIYCDTHCSQYPTVYPLKTIRTQIELDDGTEVWVDGVPEFCDKEDVVNVETAEVDLDNLCADIS